MTQHILMPSVESMTNQPHTVNAQRLVCYLLYLYGFTGPIQLQLMPDQSHE